MSTVPAVSHDENEVRRKKSLKPLLWLAIVSIIMLFAGFTSAYIVTLGDAKYPRFNFPQVFWLSSAVILLSSGTMYWAYSSARSDQLNGLKNGLLITFMLGIMFVICQVLAWGDLVNQKVFFTGKNTAGSFFYVISGMHLAHLAGGLIALVVVLVNSFRGKYHSQNLLGLQLCSIYWHFLDILWIYLCLFLYFIH
jgi:cytochrome c oxidase subunit 3